MEAFKEKRSPAFLQGALEAHSQTGADLALGISTHCYSKLMLEAACASAVWCLPLRLTHCVSPKTRGTQPLLVRRAIFIALLPDFAGWW